MENTQAPSGKTLATFFWPGEARSVYVAGEFDGWLQHQAHQRTNSGSLYAWATHLAPGTYKYKLLVDGEWRLSEADTQTTDADGNPCNLKLVSAAPISHARALDQAAGTNRDARQKTYEDAPPSRRHHAPRGSRNMSARSSHSHSKHSAQSAPSGADSHGSTVGQENVDSHYSQGQSTSASDRKSNRLSYMASKIVNRMSLKRSSGNYSAHRRSRGKEEDKHGAPSVEDRERAEFSRAQEVASEARGSWVGSNKVSAPVVFDDDAKSPEEADHKAMELRKAGKTLQGWGDFRGASACYKKAVDVREKFYINSFEATEILLEHAHILSKLGDNESAIRQLDKSLKIWERAPFEQKDRHADHLLYYAVVLDRKKKTAEAEGYYHEAIKIYHRHNIQSDNLDIAYTNLNKNRKVQGKPAVARREN